MFPLHKRAATSNNAMQEVWTRNTMDRVDSDSVKWVNFLNLSWLMCLLWPAALPLAEKVAARALFLAGNPNCPGNCGHLAPWAKGNRWSGGEGCFQWANNKYLLKFHWTCVFLFKKLVTLNEKPSSQTRSHGCVCFLLSAPYHHRIVVFRECKGYHLNEITEGKDLKIHQILFTTARFRWLFALFI